MMLAGAVAFGASCAKQDKLRVMERSGSEGTIPLKVRVTDFKDERPEGRIAESWILYLPLNFYGAHFANQRHDLNYPSWTLPFTEVVPKQLAARVAEAGAFEKVEYVGLNPEKFKDQPKFGDYDLEIQGRLLALREQGRAYKWGLSIIPVLLPLEYLGYPTHHRRWITDVEYQVVNAYTGEKIGEPIRASDTTPARWFNRYSFKKRGSTDDLIANMNTTLDGFIDGVWTQLPEATDASWTALRETGQKEVARRTAEDQQIRKGQPPRFQFTSPTFGAQVRGASTPLVWLVDSPGGLKDATLVVNNQRVDLGINPIELADPAKPMLNVPAREVRIPLQLGANKLEALVTDHRGNSSRAEHTVTRLPAELFPKERYALLVAAPGQADSLELALEDPLVGQFAADTVTKAEPATFAASLAEFGKSPKSGNLAFVVLSAKGEWDSLKLPELGLTLDEVMTSLGQSLATSEVVLVLDIAWDKPAGDVEITDRLANPLPAGWAMLAAQSTGGPALVAGGKNLVLEHATEVLRGTEGSTSRLTVERFLDDLLLVSRKADNQVVPEVYGRFTRSNTMAERE
jgi:hypothetical protein